MTKEEILMMEIGKKAAATLLELFQLAKTEDIFELGKIVSLGTIMDAFIKQGGISVPDDIELVGAVGAIANQVLMEHKKKNAG